MLETFKRGDWYHVRGTVAGKPIRRSAKTTDPERARQVADQIEREAWSRHLAGDKRASGTFAEAMTLYVKAKKPSASERRRLLKLLDYFGLLPCDRIDQLALDGYAAKHHPAGTAPATVIRETITPLTSVLRVASRRKWCDKPDFERPRVPDFDGSRALTRDEADRLIAAAAPHLKPLLAFLLATGCRIDNALRLGWAQVDLDRRRVTFLKAKNGRPYTVPLDQDALTALASLTDRNGIVFRTPAGQEYHAGEGGNPITTGFNAACRRAGIGHVRTHDLRHTFTTWRVVDGVPLPMVANLRGDRGLQMVMRYAHLAPEMLADAMARVSPDTKAAQKPADASQHVDKKG